MRMKVILVLEMWVEQMVFLQHIIRKMREEYGMKKIAENMKIIIDMEIIITIIDMEIIITIIDMEIIITGMIDTMIRDTGIIKRNLRFL